MSISQKTLIRTNEEGLLCCQFMVQVDSHTCYLEYFVSNKYVRIWFCINTEWSVHLYNVLNK